MSWPNLIHFSFQEAKMTYFHPRRFAARDENVIFASLKLKWIRLCLGKTNVNVIFLSRCFNLVYSILRTILTFIYFSFIVELGIKIDSNRIILMLKVSFSTLCNLTSFLKEVIVDMHWNSSMSALCARACSFYYYSGAFSQDLIRSGHAYWYKNTNTGRNLFDCRNITHLFATSYWNLDLFRMFLVYWFLQA